MKRVFLILTFGLVSALAAISCGSGGSSTLDPNKRIADLTPDEQAQLCDEIANAQGGYGQTVTCSDGHVEATDPNQVSCVGALEPWVDSCYALTVGEVLNCAQSQADSPCSFATDPECKAVRDCMASIPRG